jgi:hypothetical protein
MARLLYVEASPRKDRSAAIEISRAFLVKRARGPSATRYCSFSGEVRLFARIRLDHCWYIVSSIRAHLRDLLDKTSYQHFTLSREISVVFTSQGPLLYRCIRFRHAYIQPLLPPTVCLSLMRRCTSIIEGAFAQNVSRLEPINLPSLELE